MISLSTSWNSRAHESGVAIIDEIKAAGFEAVELGFALTEEIVGEILALSERGEITVTSLHNICPLPPEIPPDRASPDHYSLSAADEAERASAVEAAKRTLLYARRFGARAVVLHAGRVPIKDRTRYLASIIDDKERFMREREIAVRERKDAEGGSLQNVIRSLEELVPFAKDLGVAIGVENRYYYREIPIIDEFEEIFRRFKPGDLYYWHDVGHAEVFERLGLVRHRDLLERFAPRLIGIHLHDIIGPITDHQTPGTGTFDFTLIRPYIRPDMITVMEVHPPATAAQLREGAERLRKVLA